MWIWFVEKLHLYLLPLPLEIRYFFLQLHRGIFLLRLLVNRRIHRLLLLVEVEIVIQIVTVVIPAVIRPLISTLGDLV